MFHVLLVEDSEECQHIVRKALATSDIQLSIAATLAAAQQMIQSCNFDLVLLDLGLPDGDGLDLLSSFQENNISQHTPVFLLTIRSEVSSKVAAFSLGADDYLVKPFSPIELRARIEMRLKKQGKKQAVNEILYKGKLTLNPVLVSATVAENGINQSLELTAKEFKILNLLARNEGQVFSRVQIVEAVWGKAVHVLDRTVDSHIYGLRKKMGAIANYVECVPGSGYRFQAQSELIKAPQFDMQTLHSNQTR